MNNIDKGYIELAAAIVLQAIEDYKKALRNKDEGTIKECERFFKGSWGQWLSVCNGETIIERCKKEIEKEKKEE